METRSYNRRFEFEQLEDRLALAADTCASVPPERPSPAAAQVRAEEVCVVVTPIGRAHLRARSLLGQEPSLLKVSSADPLTSPASASLAGSILTIHFAPDSSAVRAGYDVKANKQV
jgi:hypothetical protein